MSRAYARVVCALLHVRTVCCVHARVCMCVCTHCVCACVVSARVCMHVLHEYTLCARVRVHTLRGIIDILVSLAVVCKIIMFRDRKEN